MPAVRLNGARVAYEDTGSGDPLLLLGGPQRAALLRAYPVPVLAKAGLRVVTLDPRGVPPSQRNRPALSVEEMAADAAALVQRLRLGPCAVAGDFVGALVAMELAIRSPDLVTRLVLSGARTAPSTLYRSVLEEIAARLEHKERIEPDALVLMRALQLYSPPRLTDDASLAEAMRVLADLPPEAPSELSPVRAALAYEVRAERLAEIAVPCLVLGYTYDPITPVHQAHELATHIPGAQVRLFELGHGGLVEDPNQVTAAIVEFLERTAPTGSGAERT